MAESTSLGVIPDQILASFPDGSLVKAAATLAKEALPQAILNHSIRVYLFAKWLAERESSSWAESTNLPLLFTACIGHDFGASDLYNGKQRFEVEGADAACNLCHEHGISKEDAHKVWVAIALHTSAGIAERIDDFTRLLRIAVKIDFSDSHKEAHEATAYGNEIEELLPRLEIEKTLADAVVKQAGKIETGIDSRTWPDSEKHPKASWPGILLKAHLENPEHEGIYHQRITLVPRIKTAYIATAPAFISSVNLTTGEVSEPVSLWTGTGQRNPEGPHIYKKDGYYYIVLAEGGTETGHSATIARSKSLYGPYESFAGNPILTSKNTDAYFQTVGHVDLFQDGDRKWWGIALATRSGPAWEIYPMGRETVLYPVKWEEGEWPVLEPVRGQMSGPLPFGGNNKEVKGSGPWVDQADNIDFEPGSSIPRHFLHWRTPPNQNRDYVISPEGHPNTLALTSSRANLTGGGEFQPFDGQTFVGRVQCHTLLKFSVDISFSVSAAEQESGISVFLTNSQHIDLGIVGIPNAEDRSIVPHLRLRVEASGRPDSAEPDPILWPIPSAWIANPISLEASAESDTEYKFSARSPERPDEIKTLGIVSAAILSGGSGPFTGTLLGVYATTNGGDEAFDAYISRWRYTPVAQKVAEGQLVPVQ